MKKWLVIIGLTVVVGLAVFGLLDATGVERTCLPITPSDDSGTRFSYTDPDGQVASYEMPGETKIIGLTAGEKIGLSFQRGRFSGGLYEVQLYLLSADQHERISEFSIQRSGRGSGSRAAPVQKKLPLGCPKE